MIAKGPKKIVNGGCGHGVFLPEFIDSVDPGAMAYFTRARKLALKDGPGLPDAIDPFGLRQTKRMLGS